MLRSLFRKISDLKTSKMHNEVPIKPRRKKVDVLVHQTDACDESEPQRRTFSANYPKKSKHKKSADLEKKELRSPRRGENQCEDEKSGGKISKRRLVNVNEELTYENNELREKLTSMDIYMNKKNNKFKEKLNSLILLNQNIAQENSVLKSEYDALMAQFRACQNELEVCKYCQQCAEFSDIVEKQKNEVVELSKSKQELIEDVDMLKNVVYRLNVQLERYQQKLHASSTKFANRSANPSKSTSVDTTGNLQANVSNILTDNHRDHPHTPISWGKVNAHTLGPLLDAYQDTIAEKEGIIQDYEQELVSFMEKLREIIRENENLHRLLIEDEDCSKVLAEELEKVKGELKTTKEQNDLLIKKCALKQDKIDEAMKWYENRVEILRRDLKVLQDEYYKSKTESAALKEKNKSLVQVQSDFKNERQEYIPVTVHTASVNECKKWYEELKHQYEQEKVKLKETNTELASRLGEMTEKIAVLNKEKAEMEGKIRVAEKQIKKVEAKYLDLQHTSNEMQVSRSACRKQLHKAMTFAKDLVSEQEALLKALNQRQRENKAVKKLGSDIVNRMDTLRSQLKTVQQEAFQELTTVEQRMQEQDTVISSLKKQHNEEVERLNQIIKEKEDNRMVFKENSAIAMPHYLLFRDKHLAK